MELKIKINHYSIEMVSNKTEDYLNLESSRLMRLRKSIQGKIRPLNIFIGNETDSY